MSLTAAIHRFGWMVQRMAHFIWPVKVPQDSSKVEGSMFISMLAYECDIS